MGYALCTTLLLLQCSTGAALKVSASRGSGTSMGDGPPPRTHFPEGKEATEPISRLWDGEDLDASELGSLPGGDLVFQAAMNTKVRMPSRAGSLKLAMLGPFDSGTNLLLHTLRLNYPDFVKEACAHIRDAASCRVWKHGLNLSLNQGPVAGEHPLETILMKQKVQANETVLVAMVRNPLSQMASWRTAPYNIRPCVMRNISDYASQCTAWGMVWRGTGDQDVMSPTLFESTMDVYNRYLRMYKQLKQSGRFRDVLLITYEDLVLAPEDVISDVGRSMEWPVRQKIALVDAPAKKHGHSLGRDAAINKTMERPWLAQFSREERAVLCSGLDPHAYKDLKENGRRAIGYPVIPYGADCVGYRWAGNTKSKQAAQ